MSDKFMQHLQKSKVLIADGATGTNLLSEGLPPGATPETWVIERPEKILDLALSFVRAGSDIILTSTFGATRLRLKDTSHAGEVVEINHRAVEIARQAAAQGSGTLIAGSIGPTGQLLKPLGPLTPNDAVTVFEEQARALIEGGVDLIVIETFFAIEEAQAALDAVRKFSDLPVVISFSYDRGTRTMMGVRPSQVVKVFQPQGVAAIGGNCGTSLENMALVVKEYSETHPGLVIWVKPNAGLPLMNEDGTTSYNLTPDQMARFCVNYVEAGARIVGGCCGSTPAHIAAIAKALKES